VFRNGTSRTGIGVTIRAVSGNRPRICGGALLAIRPDVIWFYERKGEHMRCEIRQLIEGDRFSLVVTLPDGTERIEVFDNSSALNRRSIELEKTLVQKGWNGPFSRGI
jgi:hypothetical protein